MPKNLFNFLYNYAREHPIHSTSMIFGGAITSVFLLDRQVDLNEKHNASVEEYKRRKHAASVIAPTITKHDLIKMQRKLVLPVIPTVDEAAMYKANLFFDEEARKIEFKKSIVDKESDINIKNTINTFLEKSVVDKEKNDLKIKR